MCSHIKYINFLVNKRRYNFLISKACVRDAPAILNSVAGIFSGSAVKTDDNVDNGKSYFSFIDKRRKWILYFLF